MSSRNSSPSRRDMPDEAGPSLIPDWPQEKGVDDGREKKKPTALSEVTRVLQTSYKEQCELEIVDRLAFGTDRKLPANELLAMALNEAAVGSGQGYFFHIRGRDCWNKFPSLDLCPEGRQYAFPGDDWANLPNLTFMNFAWSASAAETFTQSGQRYRYLACDALVNPPPPSAPLCAIQLVSHRRYGVYSTDPASVVVLCVSGGYVLADSAELEAIVGLRHGSRRASAKGVVRSPSELRSLKAIPTWFWSGGEGADKPRDAALVAMLEKKIESPRALYHGLVDACARMPTRITGARLRQLMPRAASPSPGVPLGTPLMPTREGMETLNALPTRRGVNRSSRASARTAKRVGEDA